MRAATRAAGRLLDDADVFVAGAKAPARRDQFVDVQAIGLDLQSRVNAWREARSPLRR